MEKKCIFELLCFLFLQFKNLSKFFDRNFGIIEPLLSIFLLFSQFSNSILISLRLSHIIVKMFLLELQNIGLFEQFFLDALYISILPPRHPQITPGITGLFIVLKFFEIARKGILARRVLAVRTFLFLIMCINTWWATIGHLRLVYKQYF